MGLRGPAPTPTKILKMRGTFRRDRHGGQEPQTTALVSVPRPPKHLSDTERKIWRRVARLLVASELLTANDLDTFEGYVVVYARALDAEAVVATEGRTVTTPQGLKRHPELVTAERARSDMRRYEKLFGMSPADRAGLRLPSKNSKPAADPWDDVVNG